MARVIRHVVGSPEILQLCSKPPSSLPPGQHPHSPFGMEGCPPASVGLGLLVSGSPGSRVKCWAIILNSACESFQTFWSDADIRVGGIVAG